MSRLTLAVLCAASIAIGFVAVAAGIVARAVIHPHDLLAQAAVICIGAGVAVGLGVAVAWISVRLDARREDR